MTKLETLALCQELRKIFDIVRLVDTSETTQYSLKPSGEIVREKFKCYATWNKKSRCENCISAKAYTKKSMMTKFEFVDNDIFFVISKYIEIEEQPFMLELVLQVTDETLFSAFGKNDFINAITNYNKQLYIDPLTNTYNRRYYEEQLYGLQAVDAVAMLDIDDFKSINDNFGHAVGDIALKKVAEALLKNSTDDESIIRYGGDEFIIIFNSISSDEFALRLDNVRKCIRKITIGKENSKSLSVSIGGFFSHQSASKTLDKADRLLYKAKATKNCIECDFGVGE